MSRRLLPIILASLILATSVFAEKTEWLDHYDQALSNAKETSRPIFIDCFADWCLWCHRLEDEVYTDPAFEKFIQGFVPLRIDVEDQAEGAKLAARYGVDSLPALLIVDSDGKLLDRIGGFQPAKELINGISSMQDLVQKEKLNPYDWETRQMLAEEYLFRDMNSEAEALLLRVVATPEISDHQKESAYFSLALAQYYQGEKKEALATLNKYLETFTDGKSVEDVLLLQSQIYIELDENEKARTVLQRFVARFPDSTNLQRAKSVLALLDKS